jgi:seryl-tRNA(Sec) selenium transferase
MRTTTTELGSRAQRLVAKLPAACRAVVAIGSGTSRCGGGTMPKSALDSVTLDFFPSNGPLEALAARFRLGAVPVVGFIEGGVFKLDLRTVLPHQDKSLAAAISAALSA